MRSNGGPKWSGYSAGEEAAVRLITALAAEQTDEWLSSRKYLDMTVRAEEKVENKRRDEPGAHVRRLAEERIYRKIGT